VTPVGAQPPFESDTGGRGLSFGSVLPPPLLLRDISADPSRIGGLTLVTGTLDPETLTKLGLLERATAAAARSQHSLRRGHQLQQHPHDREHAGLSSSAQGSSFAAGGSVVTGTAIAPAGGGSGLAVVPQGSSNDNRSRGNSTEDKRHSSSSSHDKVGRGSGQGLSAGPVAGGGSGLPWAAPIRSSEFAWVFTLTHETGSCMYMAPEVARKEPYNEAADVYRWGRQRAFHVLCDCVCVCKNVFVC
jgi:hypothetical protein